MADKKKPVCISVINMKGGVGKTTIAALLGRYASLRLNKKVLAVDLDPQANLSQAFMRQNYRKFISQQWPSIVEIFNGYLPPTSDTTSPKKSEISKVIIKNTPLGGENLDLIPSRFDFSDNLTSSLNPNPRTLAKVISKEFQEKDIIIIDCAPTESILTQAAYHASRYVLVPVRPEYFATIGFPLLNDSLAMFKQKNLGHKIDVAGVVINNSTYHYSGNRGGPERDRSITEIRQEAKKNDWVVFDRQIPFSRGFPKMMRGDFKQLGDAPIFYSFASDFLESIGVE